RAREILADETATDEEKLLALAILQNPDPSEEEMRWLASRSHDGQGLRSPEGLLGTIATSVDDFFREKVLGQVAEDGGFVDPATGEWRQRTCFVAGTEVLTPSGYVAIEEIQAGDTVRAFDETTGKLTWSRVTQTFVRQTDQIYAIHVPGDVIETTWSHPFYVLRTRGNASRDFERAGEWVEAKNLRAGDMLLNASGDVVVIQRVAIQMRTETVYNFEVEGQHTYFVSRGEVLVHNADYAVSDDFKIAQMIMLDTLLESVSPGAETISEQILGAIEEVLDGKGALGGSARILRTFVTAYNIPGDAEAIAAFLETMAGTGVLQRVLLADVFDNEMANIKEALQAEYRYLREAPRLEDENLRDVEREIERLNQQIERVTDPVARSDLQRSLEIELEVYTEIRDSYYAEQERAQRRIEHLEAQARNLEQIRQGNESGASLPSRTQTQFVEWTEQAYGGFSTRPRALIEEAEKIKQLTILFAAYSGIRQGVAAVDAVDERPIIVEGVYSNITSNFLEGARPGVLGAHQRWATLRSRRMDEATVEGRNEFLRTRLRLISPEELRTEIEERVWENDVQQIQHILNLPDGRP
ncbi:MAG: Hint domain-containing protein, partial [Spirochaetales bacterium]|nr:Hint domain-containing protein [Spirochaetales bacterium]